MNDLQIFKNPAFGEVRTLEENGKVLFCGKDVAEGLGYAIPSKAINDHCKGVSKMEVPTTGGVQEMLFIPESDVYRLVFSSKLPTADRFTDWVTEEILPTIRKHGAYMTPETLQAAIMNPDTMIQLCQQLKQEQEKNAALRVENSQQEQLLSEYEPKIQYLDRILESNGTLTTKQIAADYDLTAQKLNQILHGAGIQYYVNGQWLLYRKYLGLGYTKSHTVHFDHSDGTPDTRLNTRWTQKGRLMIHNLLTGMGIHAVMDRESIGA